MHYAGDLRDTKSPESDSPASEKKNLNGVRNAVQRAREEWTDAERRLRQKMRVYPQKIRKMMTRATDEPGLDIEKQSAKIIDMGKITPQPKAIVSINGHDVDEREIG